MTANPTAQALTLNVARGLALGLVVRDHAIALLVVLAGTVHCPPQL
jgi:hypothetical protein